MRIWEYEIKWKIATSWNKLFFDRSKAFNFLDKVSEVEAAVSTHLYENDPKEDTYNTPEEQNYDLSDESRYLIAQTQEKR